MAMRKGGRVFFWIMMVINRIKVRMIIVMMRMSGVGKINVRMSVKIVRIVRGVYSWVMQIVRIGVYGRGMWRMMGTG